MTGIYDHYQHGPSTPRVMRLKDRLWTDLCALAERRGMRPKDLIRRTLEKELRADTGHSYDPDDDLI